MTNKLSNTCFILVLEISAVHQTKSSAVKYLWVQKDWLFTLLITWFVELIYITIINLFVFCLLMHGGCHAPTSDCQHDGCKFDSHSEEWFVTQCLWNWAKNYKRRVLIIMWLSYYTRKGMELSLFSLKHWYLSNRSH